MTPAERVPAVADAAGPACAACLRRTWLLAALAGHLEVAWRARRPIRDVLALDDADLVDALVPADRRPGVREALRAFRSDRARDAHLDAGLTAVCRHHADYPPRLAALADAPAVLHLAGPVERLRRMTSPPTPSVAVVGSRRPSPDGVEAARALGRGLAAAGVTVVSGMALGIDSAAHAGALEAGGATVAVLAGAAERPTPRSMATLHRRLVAEQLVVSEMPPGFTPFRWCFPARNRTIAALADVTVVVEAAERSGSLITADFAAALGREVAAVPGRASSPRTRGSNGLLRDGATLVLDAADVLDALLGSGAAWVPTGSGAAGRGEAAGLRPDLAELLDRVAGGEDGLDFLAATPEEAAAVRAGLVELELAGRLRRTDGGRWVVAGWTPGRV